MTCAKALPEFPLFPPLAGFEGWLPYRRGVPQDLAETPPATDSTGTKPEVLPCRCLLVPLSIRSQPQTVDFISQLPPWSRFLVAKATGEGASSFCWPQANYISHKRPRRATVAT